MGCGGSKGATVVKSHDVTHGETPTQNEVKGQEDQEKLANSQRKTNRIDEQLTDDNEVVQATPAPKDVNSQVDQKKPVNFARKITDKGTDKDKQLINENNVVQEKRDENSAGNKPLPATQEPTEQFTRSPFDPTVEVGKKPIPLFGVDAFPLSKGQDELMIEDTFWEGKRALIPDYSRMVEIDKHAIEAPAKLRGDITKLVNYLTRIAQSELEKFRALFRWTAHNIEYDVAAFETGRRGDNSRGGVLASRKAVCEGYSELILGMCQIAGIKCEKISGHSKGAGYEPGMKDMSKVGHAWNRVMLDDQTFFCDCTWAAGSVNNTQKGLIFNRGWTEQEFLAEPQGFTGRHLTRDLTNQDCPSPYATFDQWNNEPHFGLTATFAGLHCLSHTEGVITASDNKVLIRFSLERALFRSFCVVEDDHGRRVDHAAVHWWNGNVLSCRVTLPKVGKYTFMLIGRFSSRKSNKEPNDNEVLYPTNADEAIENRLITYTIKATASKGPKYESNTNQVNLFGAPLDLPNVGLMPASPNQAIIKVDGGVGHVVFRKIGHGPSQIQSELHSFDNADKNLASSSYCETFGDWVVCHVRCPSPGFFTLGLYMKSRDGRKCFLKYIFASEGTISPFQFPVIHGMAGPRANFSDIGLTLADALTSTIVTEDGEGTLKIKWDSSMKLSISADLKDSSGSKSLHEEGHVILETSPDAWDLHSRTMVARIGIRVQTKGLYKFSLFAKQSNNVFVGNWLVVCNKSNTRELYPRRSSVVGPRDDFENLGLKANIHSRIKCKDGLGIMEVRSKEESMTEFLYTLTRTEKEEKKGQIFADTRVSDGERVTQFHFRIKEAGLFAFRLFAKQNDSDINTYVGVWLVDCDTPTKLPPYPGKYGSYGPTKNFREGGLHIDEGESKRLDLQNGEGELYITHKAGTNRRIIVRLETHGGKYKHSGESTMLDSIWTTKGELTFTKVRIRLKDTGLFDLAVFVENNNFDFAGAWLIDCTNPTSQSLFSDVKGSIGPNKRFFEMGLTGDGPISSTLRASKDGICNLSVRRDKPFKTLFKGLQNDLEITEKWNEIEKHTVMCSVKLPRHGLYALQMFASESGASSKEFMGNWILDWDAENEKT